MCDSMNVIGIDPGKDGGIAVLSTDGAVLNVVKMPETHRDILDCLRSLTDGEPSDARAFIERVASSPQMGVVSAFTFGKGFGALEMALTAADIPFEEISPLKWQNFMGCRTHGDKNVSKARAQALFPGQKITHAVADALLIAEYGRRKHIGQ